MSCTRIVLLTYDKKKLNLKATNVVGNKIIQTEKQETKPEGHVFSAVLFNHFLSLVEYFDKNMTVCQRISELFCHR